MASPACFEINKLIIDKREFDILQIQGSTEGSTEARRFHRRFHRTEGSTKGFPKILQMYPKIPFKSSRLIHNASFDTFKAQMSQL